MIILSCDLLILCRALPHSLTHAQPTIKWIIIIQRGILILQYMVVLSLNFSVILILTLRIVNGVGQLSPRLNHLNCVNYAHMTHNFFGDALNCIEIPLPFCIEAHFFFISTLLPLTWALHNIRGKNFTLFPTTGEYFRCMILDAKSNRIENVMLSLIHATRLSHSRRKIIQKNDYWPSLARTGDERSSPSPHFLYLFTHSRKGDAKPCNRKMTAYIDRKVTTATHTSFLFVFSHRPRVSKEFQ